MNHIKIVILVIIFGSLGAGCNKKLDVKPQQRIVPEEISTSADVKAVLFGAYSKLQSADAYGESYFLTSDLIASQDQVIFTGTFTTYDELFTHNQIETNINAELIWTASYAIINITNTVLDKIELVEEENREAIAAEARFIRGLVYFQLVNYYAKPWSDGNASANPGVPVTLKPVYVYDPETDLLSRQTVAQVYEQVIDDLTAAANGLSRDVANDGRATAYSALAILARVYMSQADYENAAIAANEVIESGNYSLTQTFAGAFNNVSNSSEDIFAIQQTNQSNAGTSNFGLSTFYMAYSSDEEPSLGGGRGDVQADPNLPLLYEETDERSAFFYYGYSITGVDGLYTRKWAQFYKAMPVARLAEMYLTRAEANYRKGGDPVGGVTPIEDINTVRERSLAGELLVVSEQDFIDERFRELAFEADRLWTLKRLKLEVGGLPYDDDKLVLPIPRRELDVNPNLEQNPGY